MYRNKFEQLNKETQNKFIDSDELFWFHDDNKLSKELETDTPSTEKQNCDAKFDLANQFQFNVFEQFLPYKIKDIGLIQNSNILWLNHPNMLGKYNFNFNYEDIWRTDISWELGISKFKQYLNSQFESSEYDKMVSTMHINQKLYGAYISGSANASERIKKKPGRKHLDTGMEKRKDIVLKSVLRRIRSKIRNDFINHFNYFNILKEVRLNQLKDFLADYISYWIDEEPTEQTIETLGLFILVDDYESFVNNLKASPSKLISKKRIAEMRELLNHFSFKRFKAICRNKWLCRLILHSSGE